MGNVGLGRGEEEDEETEVRCLDADALVRSRYTCSIRSFAAHARRSKFTITALRRVGAEGGMLCDCDSLLLLPTTMHGQPHFARPLIPV